MKQTNPETVQKSQALLRELKEMRGGSLVDFHKMMANDPELLQAFIQQYTTCNKNLTIIPRKYRELIIMALGCAFKTQTTINVHSKLAIEHGATIEEVGEVLRLVFMLGGVSSIIPALPIFEPLEEGE